MSTWRSPVGDGTSVWGNGWADANPIGTRYQLGSGYSIHTGADLNWNTPVWNADDGAPCYACAAGVVTTSRLTAGSWGNLVVIRHGPELYSRYGHLRSRAVQVGDTVTAGSLIGTIGGTGGHTPHLHFDISPTDILGRVPEHWPGDNRALVYQYYTDPKRFIEDHLSEGEDVVDKDAVLAEVNNAHTALTRIAALLEADAPAPPPAREWLEVYNASGGLRVRDEPNGRIVGGLADGTVVEALETRLVSGVTWVRHNRGGWSSGSYLRPKV